MIRRNDFIFHPADDTTKPMHEDVRGIITEAATRIDTIVPEGRELALVMTKLEEAMFWANAGIARHTPRP